MTTRLGAGTGDRSAEAQPVRGVAIDDADDIIRSGHRAVFGRMGRNVGWLLGGRGFAGLVSIAYLAIAARALGPEEFGGFALVIAYGGSIANFVQFKSWQAVIRFGSVQLAGRCPEALARLLGFTVTLDAASTLLGAAISVAGVHLAGSMLGWSESQQTRAALFGAVLQLAGGGTATGILRLFNRFDLQTYAEAVGPGVRLAGGALAWSLGAGVNGFLVVWAAAALAEDAAGWLAVLRARLLRVRLGRDAFSTAVRENPGLWGFMIQNNLSASIGLLWEQLGTLAVGAAGGPAAAGAFRVASKLAGATAKPIETITRALYPELARLAATRDHVTLRRVFGRVSAISGGLGVLLVLLVWQAGPTLLRVFSGREFGFAQLYLLPLTVAAAIDLWGSALEPLHNAYGRSGRVLAARSLGAAIYGISLAMLLPTVGTVAAAVAVIAASAAIRAVLALSASRLLRQRSRLRSGLRS